MFVKRILLILFFVGAATALKSQDSLTKENKPGEYLLNDYARSYYTQDMGFDLPAKWNKKLYDTIDVWLGTPYCYTGY